MTQKADKLDEIITSIIEDTPVAEISHVIDDLKTIVDTSIINELEDSITRYNLQNFIKVSNESHDLILSHYNLQENGLFIDYVSNLQFKVDHIKRKILTTTEIEDESIESKDVLIKLAKDVSIYVEGKYLNEFASTVIPLGNNTNNFKIIIIGEKSNPGNFWNGRWVSNYDYDYSNNELKGEISIDVHYYEDGNVRLKNQKVIDSLTVGRDSLIEKISQLEDQLQQELNKSFLKLNENSFKYLRRQLPITRSKINWGKSIGNYRLGKDVAN